MLLRLGAAALDIAPAPSEVDPWDLALAIGVPILVGVLALVLGLAVLFRWLKQRMRGTGEAKILGRYGEATPLRASPTALFFGLESRGRAQVRGNGVLALTPTEVWSSLFATHEELSIPLASILAVDTCDAHLGKRAVGFKLLRIRFRHGEIDDSAAWIVDAPAAWVTAIDAARRQG